MQKTVFRNKAAILNEIRRCEARDEPFFLDSETIVGGNVRFHIYGDRVEAGGFASFYEREEIRTVSELVDYAWRERKRILQGAD
jgi:hypothetical protein